MIASLLAARMSARGTDALAQVSWLDAAVADRDRSRVGIDRLGVFAHRGGEQLSSRLGRCDDRCRLEPRRPAFIGRTIEDLPIAQPVRRHDGRTDHPELLLARRGHAATPIGTGNEDTSPRANTSPITSRTGPLPNGPLARRGGGFSAMILAPSR